LPELKFVVVVSGEDVKFGATLDEALGKVFGDAPPDEEGSPGPEPAPSKDVRELIQRALDADAAAQAALRDGDFAEYGRESQRSRKFLEQASVEAERDAA